MSTPALDTAAQYIKNSAEQLAQQAADRHDLHIQVCHVLLGSHIHTYQAFVQQLIVVHLHNLLDGRLARYVHATATKLQWHCISGRAITCHCCLPSWTSKSTSLLPQRTPVTWHNVPCKTSMPSRIQRFLEFNAVQTAALSTPIRMTP